MKMLEYTAAKMVNKKNVMTVIDLRLPFVDHFLFLGCENKLFNKYFTSFLISPIESLHSGLI